MKQESIAIQPLKEMKEGVWCYYDYKLHQIGARRDYDDFSCWDMSTGFIQTSGNFEGEVYPLSLESKVISAEFEYWDKRIRDLSRSLNFPDIHRKIVSIWHKAMLAEIAEKRKLAYDEIRNFHDNIKTVIEEGSTVDGVKIMR
jgi:hypothetical protein